MRTYLFLHQAPGDYTTIDQDLTFSESFGTVCTTFLANDDMLFEDDETFSALLTTNDGSVTLEPDQTTIQINDDDGMYINMYLICIMQNGSITCCMYMHKCTCTCTWVISVLFLHVHITVSMYTAITIGFSREQYSVTEGVDGTVEICAELLSGQLGTEITVPFSTVEGTALGKYVCTCIYVEDRFKTAQPF